MGGPRQRGWAPVGLRSCFLSGLAAATGLGSRWAPFMFPFWAPGRMGGPRPRSWAPIGFPLYFLSGRLGRMGGPRPTSWAPIGLHVSFWAPGSDGWAAVKNLGGSLHVSFFLEAGLPLSSLHVSFFLGSWVGWVGRGQKAGLALGSLLGSWADGWAARPRAGLPSCFPSAALTRLGSIGLPSQPRLLPSLSSLHVSFSGSWVGWVVHGREVGLLLGSLHVCFLGSWVGWVGRGWAPIPLPSFGWVGCGQGAGLLFLSGSWVEWVDSKGAGLKA